MTETEKFKALILIDYWQEKFPAAFPKKPEPKIPLQIDIGKEGELLHTTSVAIGATQQDIDNALYLWCRGSRYWQSFKKNIFRFNARGCLVTILSAEEQKWAKQKLRTWIHEIEYGDNNERD